LLYMEILGNIKELLVIDPLKWASILTAFVCGAMVGLERQLSGKPAGIRTSILICMGSYVFVALASSVVENGGDHTRVVGQVITGIGFLGAGVMLTRDGLVVGVTSAAVIWMLAAVGCLIGMNKVIPAIFLSFVTLFILVGVSFIERLFKKLKTGVHSEKNKVSFEENDKSS
jgi:putative Mg2+ transporter-C (MgtC) family protein